MPAGGDPSGDPSGDALLRDLGVIARAEREVAKEVIRDAAVAAAARAAAAAIGSDRTTLDTAGAGKERPHDDGTPREREGSDRLGVEAEKGGSRTSSIGGVGANPALARLSRLQAEADKVARELTAVRDALRDVRRTQADGTAPPDAALVIAVGERRVSGLTERRDALAVSISGAEADAAAEATAEARRAEEGTFRAGTETKHTTKDRRAGTSEAAPRPPPMALVEDDDLDALLDSVAGRRVGTRGAHARGSGTPGARGEEAETERERLIRTGVLTPFDRLDGYERRVKTVAAEEAVAKGIEAWRSGRSRSRLLEGDDVPEQRPTARPFNPRLRSRASAPDAGARMAGKRKEWRRKMDEDGTGAKKRRRRRNRTAAYSSDEDTELEDEVEEEDDEEQEKEEGGEMERKAVTETQPQPAKEDAPLRVSAEGRGRETRAFRSAGAEPTATSAETPRFVIPKLEPTAKHRPAAHSLRVDSPRGPRGRWACPACTFTNFAGSTCCDMCETPCPVKSEPTDGGVKEEDVDDDEVIVIDGEEEEEEEVAVPSAATQARHRPAASTHTMAPPPRRAAIAARSRARSTAEEEADGLSGSDSESDYGAHAAEEEQEQEEDEDTDEEEAADDLAAGSASGRRRRPPAASAARVTPKRARSKRSGDGARRAPVGERRGGAAGRAGGGGERTAVTRERREEGEGYPAEEEVVFDGGLRVPGDSYARLLAHQKTSIKWLWELHCQRVGGIVGDEMGLGKTVQIAAFMGALERSGLFKPTLVVCPATMLRQWRRELRAWAPRLRPQILHESAVSAAAAAAARGSKKDAKLRIVRDCVRDPRGILLTTYEHLRVMRDDLLPVRWGYVILDEGHKIRNPDADITICAKQLQTVHRLILTGAPIQNRLSELWSLFDFCFPGKLGTLPVFQAQFAVPIQVGGYTNASEQQVVTAYRCATMLKDLISPFLLRRMKVDVDIQLPAKTEQVLFCPMTAEQKEAYRAYLHSRDVEEILEGRREALGGIDVLRKIVNHPDLLERATQATNEEYGDPERSGKLLVTQKVLGLWKEQGHRCLVFSQTQQMLDILEAAVAKAGMVYRRMDGQTPVAQRMRLIDEFNTDERVFVFLLTTKVGGLGVNLTGADRVLLYDPDWNPSTDAQARERAWRIGQTKEVTVYRLVTAGTIEEKVYHRQIYKEFLTSKVLKDPKQRRFFKAKDLADLFTWEEDNNGSKEDVIETAELFAEVEGEIRAADVAIIKGEEGDEREDDPEEGQLAGSAEGGYVQAVPPVEPGSVWDPDADPSTTTTSTGGTDGENVNENAQRGERPRRFAIADVPKAAQRSAPQRAGDGDAAIMRQLFSAGGDGGGRPTVGGGKGEGGGMIRGAMNHDAIMSASSGRDHLVGGSAAAEADRVARRAEQALRQSRHARGSASVAVPTWTGRSGAAGAPAGASFSAGNAALRRFGRHTSGGGGSAGVGPVGDGVSVLAGVAGAGHGALGSRTLLRRIRERDALGGSLSGETTVAGAAGSGAPGVTARGIHGTDETDEKEAERLLRDICAFLRARPSGRAPTGLVIDAFQDKVGPEQRVLFKRLLKVAATLERNPPNAKGAGGGAVWILKAEFRRSE